ncbi:sulfurtransferase TusA family protein [Streptomyces sp. NPDC057582]|uniref:sulfurtransferase TusA family protein n=1 Tax=unclassified Streptomyces TaxID=2593676 RepID=UPI0036BB62CE
MCTAPPDASSDAPGPNDSVLTVVDAGGEPWARILGLLERRWCELPVGSVLELHSANPQVRSSLRGWCRLTGSTLLTEEETGDLSAYRIKLPPPPAPGTPTPSTLQKPESP